MKEKAFAKVNLFLNVVSKRFDGYHDLEMVMAPVNFYDVLTFNKLPRDEIQLTSNIEITKKPEDNIVYKVAAFLKTEFDIKDGIHIHIDKRIPLSAGLAGGSADAAATFRALNKLWKLGLPLKDMASLGEQFGADIPYCIYNKLAIAKGKGEQLAFLNYKLKMPILLVNQNIEVSTKKVFSLVKEEDLIEKKISEMTNAIINKNYELIAMDLHNSLESIVFEMHPKIRELKNQLIDLGLNGALMSGSGATVFGLDKSKKRLQYVYDVLPDDYFKLITKLR